ncbi:hypothetical protein [Rhizobium leguminosarum]|uniref:hypothetical protein n=1 Tax=Rhizobium leguminosarum TaxID=384 RepID=UPI000B92AF8E|nr:hypothetical protein [Rhizobium leguminosarum]ASS55914.1 hypothetical protein CHR56_15820 [Rhizobium leguminosarum bv. viciae]
MALPPFANGFRPFLQNNSDMLLQAGAGLLGGATAPQQVAGLAQGVAGARQRNKTIEFLRQQSPELAAAVEAGSLTGGDAYKLFYQQKLEAAKPRNNFINAGKNLYDTNTGQWITPPAGAGGDDQEYGLNPQYGVDAQGNPVILQLSKAGTSTQTKLPDGVQLSKQPIKLDAGTEWILLDPISRQPVGRVPKNLAEAASQKEIGEAQGKAIAAAPGDLQAAQNALDTVESLRSDPNKGWGTGFSSVFNAIPGSPGKDFQKKVDQSTSGAFLTAIQQMRGLGSLSNAEGATATAAVARMDTATSEEEFNAALNDYEKIVKQGAARAQARIQQSGGQVQAPPGMTPPGATSSGVKWSVEP